MGIARGWKKRVIRTNITWAKRTVPYFYRLSPVSLSVFSFCLTIRAYLNTQNYGLFCSLQTARVKVIWNSNSAANNCFERIARAVRTDDNFLPTIIA